MLPMSVTSPIACANSCHNVAMSCRCRATVATTKQTTLSFVHRLSFNLLGFSWQLITQPVFSSTAEWCPTRHSALRYNIRSVPVPVSMQEMSSGRPRSCSASSYGIAPHQAPTTPPQQLDLGSQQTQSGQGFHPHSSVLASLGRRTRLRLRLAGPRREGGGACVPPAG